MTKEELAQKIYDYFYDCEEIELDSFIGIRALTAEEPEEGGLWNSRLWEDGDMTDIELNGTSAIKLNPYDCNLSRKDAISAAKQVMEYTDYSNPRYAIIMGDNYTSGEDYMEVVIHNARILTVFKD